MVMSSFTPLNKSLLRTTQFKCLRRLYHPASNEYVNPTTISPLTYSMDSIQSKILSHSLKEYVPTSGFNEKSILKSINDLGYSSSMMSVIGASNSPSFAHSSPAVLELIKYNLVSKRIELTKDTNDNTTTTLKELLLKRLEMDIPISSQLRGLFAQLATPGKFMFDVSLPELFQLADDMIFFSNEKDHHDMAWYSKRLAVSMAYVTSKMFMIQDTSNNFQMTMDFASDKVDRVMNLGEYYNNVEEYAWFTLMNSINLVKSQFSRM
ncbi:hypothetical protein KAFR_0L01480 [Kazachstania africana CBS 2517]|uniref:Ubiquinone biosynthesis protein n=1 Tax=Kazachstania africana (strain ATCC 22294 / BCRC 22015 / CBS 2517 / CECT 1963 / NBRC 1671 / NRRL Y-8276) TaxID=1071382 RepID=H2B2A8_KAZAF|nr:hypothetical protein KAFR_0L01480 [Kazachstania africana CBS 2517]CCF60758.1 hypothetical protein KAFR_0L01480 [Kazachstania africana CBS 2517]